MFRDVHALSYGVLTLDGGDFAPMVADSHRAEIGAFLLEAMPLLDLDAQGVGEVDLLMGPAYLREAARRLPLVAANVRFGPGLAEALPRILWLEAQGRRVAVTGYVDPVLYYEQDGAFAMAESLLVEDPRLALAPVIEEARKEADLVVVLAHARMEELTDVVAQLDGVDVVVQGHDPRGPRAESRVGTAFLVQPGPRAREVSLFTLGMSGERTVERAGLQSYRLGALTEGDPELARRVVEFQERLGIR